MFLVKREFKFLWPNFNFPCKGPGFGWISPARARRKLWHNKCKWKQFWGDILAFLSMKRVTNIRKKDIKIEKMH